jgi:hypothetical protein
MDKRLIRFILRSTHASEIIDQERIQSLWSGYGEMLKVGLQGANVDSVVVKDIQLSKKDNHPRGWNTNIGHQRKLKSYQVEKYWYENYAALSKSHLPNCLGVEETSDRIFILLEDLDEAGFPLRRQKLTWEEFTACLKWLAQFHVSFLNHEPKGLWTIGTYWHLDTRPSELEPLQDSELKSAAKTINLRLNNCRYKTFVHGDAKLANFCFSKTGKVAGVDFQYIGGGCGMKDVAYFTGSCLEEHECERLENKILDTYFNYFHQAASQKNEELEYEWRSLYRIAWADFHRFLKGWSPNHWKINSYSERITWKVIKSLQ